MFLIIYYVSTFPIKILILYNNNNMFAVDQNKQIY